MSFVLDIAVVLCLLCFNCITLYTQFSQFGLQAHIQLGSGQRTFCLSAPTVCNDLPSELKSKDISRQCFKPGLKGPWPQSNSLAQFLEI